VEEDGQLNVLGAPSVHRPKKRTMTTQSPGIWGLGRVSHRAKGISNYVFDDSAGKGTCIYVIDSGMQWPQSYN
jgi:hypothetical protein